MKIGLSFFPVRPSFLLPMAERAEALGYESLWISEHLAFPTRIESAYPYDASVGAPLPSTPLFDPLITLAYVAARTSTIQLGTAIYLLALRHPISAAKFVATLDALSGGRAILGVGAGWLKEEFDTVDIPWPQRGARLDECIEVIRRLWTDPLVAHQGRFYAFDEIGFEPKPARSPVPIVVGGESRTALRRAATLGDGWLGLRHSPASAGERVQTLRKLREADRPFEITVETERVPTADDLARYAEAGVDRLMLNARLLSHGQKSIEAAFDGLAWLADIMHRHKESEP